MKWKDSEHKLCSSLGKSVALKGSNLTHLSSILRQVHNLNPQYGGLISLLVPPTVIHSFNLAHHEFSWLKFDSLSRYLNICSILLNKTPWVLMSLVGTNTLMRGKWRTSKIWKKKKTKARKKDRKIIKKGRRWRPILRPKNSVFILIIKVHYTIEKGDEANESPRD